MAERIDVFARKNLSDSYSEISNHLSEFLGKLFVQLNKRQPAWYGEQQMGDDIKKYNEKRNYKYNNDDGPYHPCMVASAEYLCTLCGVGHWEEITDTAKRSASVPDNGKLVENLDLSGLRKALEIITKKGGAITNRFANSSQDSAGKKEKILFFFDRFKDFRNKDAHKKKADDPKFVQGLLTQICRCLADPDIRKAFQEYFCDFDEKSERLFDSLHEELKQLTEDIALYLDGYVIDQNADTALNYRHLYKYRIVADEWAFQSKYSSFLTEDVMPHTSIHVFDSMVKALQGQYEASKQGIVPEGEGEVSRMALRNLANHVKKWDEQVIVHPSFCDEDGIPFDYTWDNIHTLLKEKPDERIAVITDEHSEVHARQIIACGNPNHVVVYLNSSSTVKPAIPPEQEPPPGEPAQEAVWAKEAEIELLELPSKGDVVFLGRADSNVSARLGKRLGGGAEGDIYESDADTGAAIKIYKTESLAAARSRKLESMRNFYTFNTSKKQASEKKKKAGKKSFQSICWPVNPVFYKGRPVGYEMTRVPDGYTLSEFLSFLKLRDRLPSFPEVTRSNLIQICEQITRVFDRLHELKQDGKPVLMGDVNPKNIMVSYDKTKEDWQVWLIDVDSFQFGSEPCTVGRPEFYSPRIAQAFSSGSISSIRNFPRFRNDEKFAVAVLLFHVLMVDRFPYQVNAEIDYFEAVRRGRFIFAPGETQAESDFTWQNLSEELQRMFQQVFGGGENRKEPYPELQNWQDALSQLRSETKDAKRYSNELFPTSGPPSANDRFLNVRCPKCGVFFETTEESRKRKQGEPWCPKCEEYRTSLQANIKSCRCRICGSWFTISEWDDGNDEECPDCCPELEITGMEAFTDRDSFPDNLRKKVIAAVSNYLKCGGSDNDR